MVESMIAYSKSGSSESAANMRCHTLPRFQRLNRVKRLFHAPNAGGRSRQGAPVRAIHSTPSTNIRLSLPVTPGSLALPAHRPSIRCHCSALSTKRTSSKTASPESAVLNHKSTPSGILNCQQVLGRVVLSTREHPAAIEPHGAGLLLTTLRAANEVRPAPEIADDDEVNDEAVALATMIIERRSGHFNPKTFHDRYQDALRSLVEARAKGRTVSLPEVTAPAQAVNLMDALKRSLAATPSSTLANSAAGTMSTADTHQPH